MSKRGTAAMSPENRMIVAKKGGDKCLEKFGRKHFSEIGKKGGKAMVEKRGKEYFRELGRRGGNAAKIKAESNKHD